MRSDWNILRADKFIDFNPKETIRKGELSKKVTMEQLQPYTRDLSGYELTPFNGGSKFRNGDTLMARITPCLENGKTAQVNILENGEVGFGSTEFIVMREIPGVSDSDFIYYLALSSFWRNKAIKSMVGSSGRQRVQQSVLDSVELCVPSLPEQKEIARTLRALDDKITNNREINLHLKKIAQAIFKSWFVDFEPFGGVMPDDWREGTIVDIAVDIVCGKTPSTKVAEYFGDDIPFITIPDMHGRTYITTTERSLSMSGASSQSRKTVPANSVCVSCIATAGLVVLTSKPSQTNQQINTIVCKNEISPFYVYLTMVGMADHIRMLGSSGSATNNLNKGQFSKIEILIPSAGILDEFSSLVMPVFEEIKRNQQESDHLAQTRNALLTRLMSGEISVINDKHNID